MQTFEVKVRDLVIGGNAHVVVQTMCNTHTQDIQKSVDQCIEMINAGAKMIRLTTQGMKEVEALKAIKSADSNAKVIMCSAMGQQAMVIESIQAGAKDFIVKPFQADRGLEAVKKVVG